MSQSCKNNVEQKYMNKLLTIVIPTYNMQDYLHRCLDSLILNDEALMEQLEVLVVNDGRKTTRLL